jgi:hypothetical protein
VTVTAADALSVVPQLPIYDGRLQILADSYPRRF